uniref:TIR domain-containing protein n=1 Tax=Steinernema glaseri TaxID=37863 RepID=A0A1I7ZTB7_9BILA
MDGVPFAFCEAVCGTIFRGTLRTLGELSGYYGDLARRTYSSMVDYIASVEDGVEHSGFLRYWSSKQELHKREEMEAVSKKFVQILTIHLLDGKEVSVCREIVKRFPYSSYQFALRSSTINEAWVQFACSLKRLDALVLMEKLDDDAIRLFQKFVDGRKLFWLPLCEEACGGVMLEVLKALLCQEQFTFLTILSDSEGPWKSTVVQDLLHFWSENGAKLRGKTLSLEENCKDGVQQLEQFLLHRAASKRPKVTLIQEVLEVCSKEECDFLEKYYQHNHTIYNTPSCVYKYEEGEGDERRRLYISFECASEDGQERERPKSPNGYSDLNLMRDTCVLRVKFA